MNTWLGIIFAFVFIAAIFVGIRKRSGEAGSKDPGQNENILEDHTKKLGKFNGKKE